MDFMVKGGVRILRPKGAVMTNFGPRAEMSLRRPRASDLDEFLNGNYGPEIY